MIGGLTAGQVAGLVMLSSVVPAVFVLRYVWPERRKPGVLWFLFAIVAGMGWAFTSGLNPIITAETPSIVLYNVNVLVVALATVSWLLLAAEYTTETRVSAGAFAVLVVLPLATQLLLWTNADHHLVFETIRSDGGLLQLSPGPWWYVATGYNYLLVLLASGMWLGQWFSTSGTRRRQTELFLFATAILTGTAILFNARVLTTVDTPGATVAGPVSFIVAGAILAYALAEYEPFRLAPVARETTVAEIDDAVVALDDEDTVVDLNPAARRLFGFAEGRTGDPAAALFDAYPALLDQLAAGYDHRTEITLTVDGVDRDVDLDITPVEYGRGSRGRVVVLRDITSLKQRERDLALVKRVLTRVFRHNVRNDVTTIRGYAEVIERRGDEDLAEHAEVIIDQSDELIAQSEKARLIEEIVDAEEAIETVELGPLVRGIVAAHRKHSPGVDIETSIRDGTVRAHREIGQAIDQLVENAIEHADGSAVTVSVEINEHEARVIVADDGSGMPAGEIDAILNDKESDLEHGSGLGLRLVKWIVDHSGGRFHIENDAGGCRTVITLQRAED
jgi:PAS domain S-box-containing protein